MRHRLYHWFGAPLTREPFARQQTALLQTLLMGVLITTAVAIVLNSFAFRPAVLMLDGLIPNLILMLCLAAALAALRRDRFGWSVGIAIGALLLGQAYTFSTAGIRGNEGALIIFVIPITLAGLLVGRRGLVLVSALSVGIVLTVAVLKQSASPLVDVATSPRTGTNATIAMFVLIVSMLSLALNRFGRALRDALAAATTHEQELTRVRDILNIRTADLSAVTEDLRREALDRERAETALRASEARYRLLAEHAQDLIGLLDPQGRLLYAAPSFGHVLGYAPAALAHQNIYSMLHPDDAPHLRAILTDLLAPGTSRTVEVRLRKTSGAWIDAEVILSALTDHTTGAALVLLSARDITARKQLETRLHQSHKLESIGRLAGGIAHDFNNLLTAITGYTSLVWEALPPDDPAQSDLQQIQRAVGRASDLTRQLLAFARQQIIEPHVINLNDLVFDMDQLLRRLIGEDIEQLICTEANLGHVRVDPGQIEQVLVNLAANARDAMPDGGKLIIETKNVTLDDTYARQHAGVTAGPYVMLAVTDTGSGMDAAIWDHIFEPFFTTKDSNAGTGLGLATCYGIVKQHNGHISVYSEPGQGTTFKVYLPRVQAAAEALPHHTLVDILPRGSETVLLVEDKPSVREVAARVLRAQGYTVLEAGNGDEALAVAQRNTTTPIQLLLTDVVMPQMGGKQLAEQLTAQYPGVKVLFTSGYTDTAITHEGRLAPGVAFLQKPFSAGILAQKTREVLDA